MPDISQLTREQLLERKALLERKQQLLSQQEQAQPQESIPQMLGRNLGQAAQQTYGEVVSPVLSGVSTAAFGLPKALIPEKYRKAIFPEQQTVGGKVLRGASEAAGFMGGGAVKVGGKLAKKVIGDTLRKKVARGAIQYGTAGALQTPETSDIPIAAPQERLMQGITGATLGGAFEGLSAMVKSSAKWLNPKNQLKLADDARNSLTQQKTKLIDKYGDVYKRTIKQSQGQVSLREPLLNVLEESDDVVNTITGNVEIREALAKGDPNAKRVMDIVNKFLEKPGELQNVSIQEADALQKYIKGLPGLKSKLARSYKGGQVDFTNAERVLLNFSNDIKAQVMNLSPEMNLVNKEYGQFMSNYKMIRPYLKWNNAIPTLLDIQNPNKIAILDLMQKALPKNIINDVLQMNRTVKNAALLKKIAAIGAGGAIGGVGGKIGWELMRKK